MNDIIIKSWQRYFEDRNNILQNILNKLGYETYTEDVVFSNNNISIPSKGIVIKLYDRYMDVHIPPHRPLFIIQSDVMNLDKCVDLSWYLALINYCNNNYQLVKMTLSQSGGGYIVSLVSESIDYNFLSRDDEETELLVSTYLSAFFDLRDKFVNLCEEYKGRSINQLL